MSRLHGTIIAGGVECPLIQLDDGRVFALERIGKLDAPVGASLHVLGHTVRLSMCQQGQAFAVTRVLE